MRSKAPLALMEQMVMLLVFALAAALCLQAFVKSDAISAKSEARDHAALAAQNAAELIRSGSGDMAETLSDAAQQLGGSYEQGILWIDYDENWNVLHQESGGNSARYRLTAQGVPDDTPGLLKSSICVVDGDAEETEVLFELEVAWQGVMISG